jgi:hypothetical protein
MAFQWGREIVTLEFVAGSEGVDHGLGGGFDVKEAVEPDAAVVADGS